MKYQIFVALMLCWHFFGSGHEGGAPGLILLCTLSWWFVCAVAKICDVVQKRIEWRLAK